MLYWPLPAAADEIAASAPVAAGTAETVDDDEPPADAALGTAAVLDADFPGLHGQASFYGNGFKGRRTATGERFDPRQATAASNRFPLGTRLAVLRPDNDRCAIVKVNDRMHAKHRRRIVDVSRGVAERLGMIRAGVAVVRVMALPDGWSGQDEAACRALFAVGPGCADCPPVAAADD